ncbi:MAG: hypothetical protein ACQZ3M_05655 [cyanobacterium endosymbiont of Rhopalodia fuxianensis]
MDYFWRLETIAIGYRICYKFIIFNRKVYDSY